MDKDKIIEWLKYDLNENYEIRKGMTRANGIKKTDNVIEALEAAINNIEKTMA